MPFDLHTPSFLALLALLVACSSEPASQKTSNRLIRESSPYLQQHARNPVDWYPWGPEALDRAREKDRLLVISIGYAACHWCHVMERETFTDTAVARLMNAHFVSVKVDREERPDVDAIYMNACRISGEGGCGWPLNAIALPDGRPVWVGTYLPREDWQEVLRFFRDAWPAERANLEAFAGRLTRALQPGSPPVRPAGRDWSPQAAGQALSRILGQWDMQYGGRRGAPKFPMPGQLDLLLRYHGLSGADEPLQALQLTLDQMAKGGLHDQLAGGFSRYATDTRWRIPHFEKMLYDNAQLLGTYARAWQHTGQSRYREAAEGIGHWLLAEMRSEEGGYFASLDADDAKGEEGAYYSWSLAEVRQLLGDQAPLAEVWYGLSEQGNWTGGKNILYARRSLPAVADSLGIPLPLAREQAKQVRTRMLEARRKRSPPARDEKIITAWNALLVRGLASAYRALGDTLWREEALRLGRFLIRRQQNPEGGLFRIHKDGRSYGHAFLDDYAFLAAACLDLYEITFDTNWIARAQGLADHALRHFDDPDDALLFYSSRGDSSLIVRLKETEDGVIPSSNAVFAEVLFRLGKLLDDPGYSTRSRSMLLAMGRAMEAEPSFFYRWWQLYLQQAYPFLEVAIVGPSADSLRAQLQARYLPQALWVGGLTEGNLPLLQRKLVPGQTTIYVCRDKVCQRPVTRVGPAWAQLKAQFPALR